MHAFNTYLSLEKEISYQLEYDFTICFVYLQTLEMAGPPHAMKHKYSVEIETLHDVHFMVGDLEPRRKDAENLGCLLDALDLEESNSP